MQRFGKNARHDGQPGKPAEQSWRLEIMGVVPDAGSTIRLVARLLVEAPWLRECSARDLEVLREWRVVQQEEIAIDLTSAV